MKFLLISSVLSVIFVCASASLSTLHADVENYQVTCKGDEDFLKIVKRIKKEDPRFRLCMMDTVMPRTDYTNLFFDSVETMGPMIKSHCTQINRLTKCMKPLIGDYEKCLTKKGAEIAVINGKLFDKVLTFWCGDDGQKLVDALEHGAMGCLMPKFGLVKMCLARMMNIKNWENMVGVNVDTEICTTITDTKTCLTNLMRDCPDQELVTMGDEFFRELITEMSC